MHPKHVPVPVPTVYYLLHIRYPCLNKINT